MKPQVLNPELWVLSLDVKGSGRNICLLSLGHNPEVALKTLYKPLCDVSSITISITKNSICQRAGGHLEPVSAQVACKEWIRMQTTCDKPVMIWTVDQSHPGCLEATLGKRERPSNDWYVSAPYWTRAPKYSTKMV